MSTNYEVKELEKKVNELKAQRDQLEKDKANLCDWISKKEVYIAELNEKKMKLDEDMQAKHRELDKKQKSINEGFSILELEKRRIDDCNRSIDSGNKKIVADNESNIIARKNNEAKAVDLKERESKIIEKEAYLNSVFSKILKLKD